MSPTSTTTIDKTTRITVDLGSRDLIRRLKIAAAEHDMTVREIVTEAVSFWLNHEDLVEDTLAAELVKRREAESGGEEIPLEEAERRLGRA